MILFNEFKSFHDAYALAVALYLDGYVDGNNVLHLPKRQRQDIMNTRRMRHVTWWSTRIHTQYRKLPDTLKLEQYAVLDDGWAASTLKLLQSQFSDNISVAARIAFYMWERLLFWGSNPNGIHGWYARGFVTTTNYVAEQCACTPKFAGKVIGTMLDADLIHRKWVGSNYTNRGSCYLPGPKDNLAKLLEKSNMES